MDFGITSPMLGVRDNIPRILLTEAFVNRYSRNVLVKDQVIQKMQGRLPAFKDSSGDQIATPKYIYSITAVDQANHKFTISGNHASEISAETTLRVNGSTGNDKLYTLVSATDVGSTTEVVVSENIPDATADGNLFVGITPIMAYYCHTHLSTGVDYLLVATAYHILLWNDTLKTYTVKFTCSSPDDVESWSFASVRNKVYATNNVDLIQVWDVDTPSGSFADLDSSSGLDLGGGSYCTKAKYLFNYRGYLLVGYTTENGELYPKRVRWCTQYDPEDFDETNPEPGHVDFETTQGYITGFARYLDYIIVAKSDDIVSGYLTTEDIVFVWSSMPYKTGCLSQDTLINDKDGNLYWLADDLTIRNTRNRDIIPQLRNTIKDLNLVNCKNAKAIYDPTLNIIYFAVPSGASEQNNLVVAYDVERGVATLADMDVACFGAYYQQERYTYDSLPYSDYDSWGSAWGQYDYGMNEAGSKVIIAADYEGNTYQFGATTTDKGDTFTGTIYIETDLTGQKSLNIFKRLNDRVRLFFKALDDGDVTVSVQVDGNDTWHTIGTGSLASSSGDWVELEFVCDVRGKHFTFKIESDAMFVFYGMMFVNFELDDDT